MKQRQKLLPKHLQVTIKLSTLKVITSIPRHRHHIQINKGNKPKGRVLGDPSCLPQTFLTNMHMMEVMRSTASFRPAPTERVERGETKANQKKESLKTNGDPRVRESLQDLEKDMTRTMVGALNVWV